MYIAIQRCKTAPGDENCNSSALYATNDALLAPALRRLTSMFSTPARAVKLKFGIGRRLTRATLLMILVSLSVRRLISKTLVLFFLCQLFPSRNILVLFVLESSIFNTSTRQYIPTRQRNPASSCTFLPHHTWDGCDEGAVSAILTRGSGV
jgi:hypothetical protein